MSSIQSVYGQVGPLPQEASQASSSKEGVYRSPNFGANRTVVALTKADKDLNKKDVAAIRESFVEVFGEKITSRVFRRIESLQKKAEGETLNFSIKGFRIAGTAVTGKDVQMAALAAMEQLQPGLKFHQQVQQLDQSLASLESQITKLESQIAAAEHQVSEARIEKEEYGMSVGEYSTLRYAPHAQSKIINGEAEIAKLKPQLEPLKTHLADVRATREEARQSLEDFLSALTHPSSLGEDTVTLEKQSEGLSGLIASKKAAVLELRGTIRNAQAEVEDRWKSYDDCHENRVGASLKAPGLMGEIQRYTEKAEAAQKQLDQTTQTLEELEKQFAETTEQLGHLRKASSFYRTQLMLDKVGSDPRFRACMDKVAPGKTDGGALGYLEAKLGGITKASILDKVVGIALPPVGVGRLFYKAIKAEDRERYLNVAVKQDSMKAYPVARSLASALASANEQEKYKLGISGTLSFVGTVVTLHLPGQASAFGSVMAPLFNPALQSVNASTTHAIGSLAGEAVTFGASTALNKTKDVASALVQAPLDKVIGAHQQSVENQKLERAIGALKYEDGQGLPMIPIPDLGGTMQFHSMEDPEIAIGLLTYLGPAVDHSLIARGGVQGESELRRQALRSEIFGARDAEDFTAGPSKRPEQDKRLIEDFNSQKGIRPTRQELNDVSPLHLLSVSSGLVTL